MIKRGDMQMRKFEVNKKGLTLAEEIVNLVLLTILIVLAIGTISSQMRIFAQDACALAAQQKGVAMMEQLVADVKYSSILTTSEDDDTDSYSDTYPYELTVYLEEDDDDNYLSEELVVDSTQTVTNKVCRLGSYDAFYSITVDEDNTTATIYLSIEKSGTVYYTERRTVELKNGASVAQTDYYADFTTNYDSLNDATSTDTNYGDLVIYGLE